MRTVKLEKYKHKETRGLISLLFRAETLDYSTELIYKIEECYLGIS